MFRRDSRQGPKSSWSIGTLAITLIINTIVFMQNQTILPAIAGVIIPPRSPAIHPAIGSVTPPTTTPTVKGPVTPTTTTTTKGPVTPTTTTTKGPVTPTTTTTTTGPVTPTTTTTTGPVTPTTTTTTGPVTPTTTTTTGPVTPTTTTTTGPVTPTTTTTTGPVTPTTTTTTGPVTPTTTTPTVTGPVITTPEIQPVEGSVTPPGSFPNNPSVSGFVMTMDRLSGSDFTVDKVDITTDKTTTEAGINLGNAKLNRFFMTQNFLIRDFGPCYLSFKSDSIVSSNLKIITPELYIGNVVKPSSLFPLKYWSTDPYTDLSTRLSEASDPGFSGTTLYFNTQKVTADKFRITNLEVKAQTGTKTYTIN